MLVTILLSILFTIASAAQNTQVELFLPEAYDNTVKFGVSVVDVYNEQTVYAVQCTEGLFASTITCGPAAPTFTITEGPSRYTATTYSTFFYTSVTDGYETQLETCDLHGTTEATCVATVVNSATGTPSSTTVTSILTGPTVAEYYMYTASVTAGLVKLSKSESLSSTGVRTETSVVLGSLLTAFVFVTALIL